jgi:predicted nuclease of predicted toxin-antitoxin system
MKILADEGVDKPIVDQLRQDGHSVAYISESDPGASDDTVLELANKNSAVLLTADKDFGELVYRLRRVSKGVILIRLSGLSTEAKTKIAATAIKEHADELENAFTVISPDSIRIRRNE